MTTEGDQSIHYMLKNLFFLYETYGLPLDIMLIKANSAGLKVNLYDFYLDARKKGMAGSKITAIIKESLDDAEIMSKAEQEKIIDKLKICNKFPIAQLLKYYPEQTITISSDVDKKCLPYLQDISEVQSGQYSIFNLEV